MDADDILKAADLQKLLELKKNLPFSIDVVSMLYNSSFDKLGNPNFYFRRNRLVKRDRNFKWYGVVHEYLDVAGEILYSDIAITHNKHIKKGGNDLGRNLRLYAKQMKSNIPFSTRDLFYYANELRENHRFEQAIRYYNRFLATKEGWVEDNIRACLYLALCYRELGKEEEEIRSLLHSFKYDQPRAEVCC